MLRARENYGDLHSIASSLLCPFGTDVVRKQHFEKTGPSNPKNPLTSKPSLLDEKGPLLRDLSGTILDLVTITVKAQRPFWTCNQKKSVDIGAILSSLAQNGCLKCSNNEEEHFEGKYVRRFDLIKTRSSFSALIWMEKERRRQGQRREWKCQDQKLSHLRRNHRILYLAPASVYPTEDMETPASHEDPIIIGA